MTNSKTKLDKDYFKEQASKATQGDLDETINKRDKIESKLVNSGMLQKYFRMGKLMLQMLSDYKDGAYKSIPWFTVGSIVFALLYVLNPLDIVPDFIPGLGYIDDLSVMTFAMRFIESDLHNYLDWKEEESDL